MEKIIIVYSTDSNYAQHAGISIISILENIKGDSELVFYIIEYDISLEEKKRLRNIIDKYTNASIDFVNFEKYKSQLNLNMCWSISISSYARLFVGSIIQDEVERVIYLDCDTIINDDIIQLWKTDLRGCIVGGVQDSVSKYTKESIGMNRESKYINAGVLLIDLKKWRMNGIEEQCVEFINRHCGQVIHHDQGVINGVLAGRCRILELKYNVMTIHYMLTKNQLLRYFKEDSEFYSDEEIQISKSNPFIIHFTPSFTSRPWIRGCRHPLQPIYNKYKNMSPWSNRLLQRNREKWYIRIVNWSFRNLPFSIATKLFIKD